MCQVAELMPQPSAKTLVAVLWGSMRAGESDWTRDKVWLQVLFRPRKVTGEHSSGETTSSYNYPAAMRFGFLIGTALS